MSVGERQRIALARALFQDPAILIINETSSALDWVSEAAIASVFGRVLRGRTAILITHRMSLVERADMVMVLDQGRILEMGPPAGLLASGGFLARQFQHSRLAMHRALRINGASPGY